MPQLNPEFFVSQLFWLVVTFSFLLFFLWKISLPRISLVLEKRENKINNDIKTAKQLQTEAEEIQNKIEKQLRKIKEQTASLIKDAVIKMQKKANKELSKLDNELNKKIDESALLVESNKKASLTQIHLQIQEITKLSLSKITSMTINDHEIKQSIANIQSKIMN